MLPSCSPAHGHCSVSSLRHPAPVPAPVPQVREGADFVSRLQTENLWVVVLEKMRKGLG